MNRHDKEAELAGLLLGRQVDGIIIIPSNERSNAALEKFIDRVPVVFIGDNAKDTRRSYVAVDNYQGTILGTDYLFSLGHRSIVYVGHRNDSHSHKLRVEGFISACKAHGIRYAVIENHEPFSSIDQGHALASELFAGDFPYTAVFAATDTTALGVMQAADEKHIEIPRDVSLIGFDNISYSMLPRINLTTIEQPFDTLASSAVDMLINHIQDPSASYSHIVFAPSLVTRGTCKNLIHTKGQTI
jgi:LacI family transcriptional regulator